MGGKRAERPRGRCALIGDNTHALPKGWNLFKVECDTFYA
jgi:hypothetical protein